MDSLTPFSMAISREVAIEKAATVLREAGFILFLSGVLRDKATGESRDLYEIKEIKK